MTVYLGTLGRMVAIYTTPSASVAAEERYTFSTTLEGRRKAQVRAVGRRTWTWNAGFADSKEQSAVIQFADGSWGPGPFVFVSADAPFTNMLMPEIATCGPAAKIASVISLAGPHYLGNGVYSSRSLVNTDPSVIMYFGSTRVPLVDQRIVTASAWVSGSGAAVRIFWYDVAGSGLGSATSTVLATSTTTVRSWVSAVPPVGAVACLVGAVNAIRGAQPAITWTDDLAEWSDGQGCPKAVVHGMSRDIALTAPGRTYSNLGFTISEVG